MKKELEMTDTEKEILIAPMMVMVRQLTQEIKECEDEEEKEFMKTQLAWIKKRVNDILGKHEVGGING